MSTLTTPPRVQPIRILILLHILVLVSMVAFLARQKGTAKQGHEQIVVIPVRGMISSAEPLDRGQEVADLVDSINDMRDDDNVKGIVLDIDSPGGSVGAVQMIHEALKKFRAKGKPVVSAFGDVAASGGYYIAMTSNKILCQPGTLTGSIGVVMQLPNVQGLLSKVGVTMQVVKSGAMKDSGSPFRQMSPEEKAYFQSLIDDTYDQFLHAVMEGRRLDKATLSPLADGRVFSGRIALDKKLVDGLGGVEEAVAEVKKLTGLTGKEPQIIYHEPSHGLERLLRMFSKSPVQELTSLRREHTRLLYLLE